MNRTIAPSWERVPSVTKGGKPYFWTREWAGYRLWVTWDRVRQLWAAQLSDRTVDYYETAAHAKQALDRKCN